MISIKDTVGSVWVPCPKCKCSVCITDWGEQTCIYEKCDGNKFLFELNFDTAKLILEEIQRKSLIEQSKPKPVMFRPSMPKLQKVLTGHILVPQSDSSNPADWYNNDPFKK